jgi:nitroreductase
MFHEALTEHRVHSLLSSRWSPYGFDERLIATGVIASLFEAARWAPSSYNEQPWAFLIARRDDVDAFERMLACLVEANQTWAKHAPLLVITVASRQFSRNANPNRHAFHDVGLAVANLSFEATSRGLAVHQMAGFDLELTRRTYGIPDSWEPATAVAIGYPAPLESLSEELRQRDEHRRPRKPISEFVFGNRWSESVEF